MRKLHRAVLIGVIASIAVSLMNLSSQAFAKGDRSEPVNELSPAAISLTQAYLPWIETNGSNPDRPHATATPKRTPTQTPTPTATATPTAVTCPYSNLVFVSGTKGDFVTWFNANARPQDEALANMINVSVLAGITIGRKDVYDPSYADAQINLPPVAHQINLIGYDLEHWSLTPTDEQADPVGTVKAFSSFAHSFGLAFNVVPDRSYLTQYGTQFAPYADQIAMQLQRLQTDNNVLLNYAIPMAQSLKAANPKLKLIAQFDTSGGVSQLVTLTGALEPYIDGVSVLTPLGTGQVTQDFATQYIMCQ